MTTCIMGLGNVGLPVAKYIHKRFASTVGYDINEDAVTRALNTGVKASMTAEYADVYVVCVSTYYRNGVPDMTSIDSCCRKISRLNADALVCFESTLAVGTARSMALEHGLRNIAVCPHRWWEEDQKNHGVKQLRVLGALDGETMEKARAFYKKLRIPVHPVSSLEIAEATKIAENAHRYVEIAFVEELKLIADANRIDFKEWRDAINTKWNVRLLEAREGIGKECLPKDTAFLASIAPNAGLLTGAIRTNDCYVQRFAKQKLTPNNQVPLMPLAERHSP